VLRLKELELIQLLRQPGGADFVLFCNEVIRATCWAHGVPQAEVSTTTRSDARDGGVDTRVGRGVTPDRFGYFQTRSVWQFKAADEANVTASDMPAEVNKPHARRRIEEDHAYRLCVCDHLTDEKKASLEQALESAVHTINSSAPMPKVLGIADIVVVANSYPALVMQYRPGLAGICILFERWGEGITRVTPKFIPPDAFEATKGTVQAHADFGIQVDDAVIAMHGQSGVGKTRTAYECFREKAGASTIVLYSDNEERVGELADMLVNDEPSYAVVVADECSLATRVRLSRKLTPCRNRVRCICIDSSTERPASAAPELAISKPSYVELQKILAANFPQIPGERLRAYAELSEGFVRIAADLCCNYDDKIRQAGHIGPIAPKLEEYYRERLGTDKRMQAVEAVSLLKRVRRKGEAPTELDQLCDITGVKRSEIEQDLGAIKDVPGFVERGELYYRVTPELVAMIAFEAAWKRWAEKDPDRFLESIPPGIQEAFLQRVSEGRSVEVRKTVQGFFRRFADSFTPRELADIHLVNKLIRVIETDPEIYLPRLRKLVDSATHEDLTGAPKWPHESWGPRRELVWLAERFAQFQEFFTDCEKILYVLARHECEPNIGNNATKTWQCLFRIQLSGTPLPLPSRLDVLRGRLQHATEETATLVAGALDEILNFMGTRMVGPAVVAGRIVPPEWHPHPQQVRELILSALLFIEEASRHPVPSLAQKAKDAFLRDIEFLARQGWIDQLRPLVADSSLEEDDRARLVSKLKSFAAWGKHPQGIKISDEYARKINDWIAELEPRSLHARLIEIVGARSWDNYGRENEWQSALGDLAVELLRERSAFDSELDWLTSPEATSSFEFGYALGGMDSHGTLLDNILDRSIKRELGFARGYIAGLLYVAGVDPMTVNERLNTWEEKDSLFSFQLALAGGDRVNVFDRAVRLIRANRLPAHQLRNFTHWVGSIRVTNDQVLTAIEILLPRVEGGEEFCSDVLMDFLGARFHAGQLPVLLSTNAELVWKALIGFTNHPGREAFWWGQTLRAAAPDNPRLAVQLACKALLGESFEMSDVASNLLSQWASTYPNEIMSEVGAMMLDPTMGVRFFLSKFPVFTALPLNVVTDWLSEVGPEGAQKLARHLPHPHLDAAGQPVVPDLTVWVLSRFEDDDRVFVEFCAGVHSFQMYTGNIAAIHESEAEIARKFFGHQLRRIDEWARIEYESALQNARRHREWEDEMKP
jgi:hypothetical protein